MTTYAYLRVSTDQQDIDNQRYGIFGVCQHPSGGTASVRLDPAGAWRLQLARELKAAGFEIDMNKAV